MREQIVSGSSGERSWKDDDKFIGSFQGIGEAPLQDGGKGKFLMFITAGGFVERWVTKTWSDLLGGKKPVVKVGMVFDVEALPEMKVKGSKNRFRPFSIVRLTGTDIPKGLRT